MNQKGSGGQLIQVCVRQSLGVVVWDLSNGGNRGELNAVAHQVQCADVTLRREKDVLSGQACGPNHRFENGANLNVFSREQI